MITHILTDRDDISATLGLNDMWGPRRIARELNAFEGWGDRSRGNAALVLADLTAGAITEAQAQPTMARALLRLERR